MEKSKKKLLVSMGLIAAFVGWTIAVRSINVEPIGPQGSQVGFAAINRFVHQLTGVHFWLYTITDWLGLIPVGVCTSFGFLGLAQWIRRKKLSKVDWDLLALGVFYLIVISAYLFFEAVVINNRPVLIEGVLEASYPSSTTMLVLCVMPTAVMQLKARMQNKFLSKLMLLLIEGFTVFMVAGRLLSGVHWLTDIVGGVLLSSGLVIMYDAVYSFLREKR